MTWKLLLALVLLAFSPTVLQAQAAPMVVVDSLGVVVGDALEPPDENRVRILLRQGDSDFLIVWVDATGFIKSHLYFEELNCTGQAWIERFYLPAEYWIGARHCGILGPSNTLYRVMGNPQPPGSMVSHRSYSDGECYNQGTGGSMVAVESAGAPPAVTPPFALALNSVIFEDQFATGDMSRWSNY